MARDFKTFNGSDEVNRLQDNIVEVLNPLIIAPLSSSVLLTNVALSAVPTKVAHKLGRHMQGWIVAAKNANEDVWEIESTKSTITLQATGDVILSLLVF